jgi:hypothetical protein
VGEHGRCSVDRHSKNRPRLSLEGKVEGEMQGFIAVFTVLRLPTPLKMSYEAAKKQAGRTPRSWESYERRETVQLV